MRAVAQVKMVFSGITIGLQVQTGGALSACAPASNPCRQVTRLTRRGWEPDPLASHLIVVPYMNIRDGASGSSACENCLSPYFL